MASQRTKDGSKASTQFGAGGRPKAGSLLVNTKNVSRRDGQSVSFKLHHEESAELKELKEILGPNMSMPDFVLSAARTWRDSKNSTAALLISSNEDAIDALAKQSNERFARLEDILVNIKAETILARKWASDASKRVSTLDSKQTTAGQSFGDIANQLTTALTNVAKAAESISNASDRLNSETPSSPPPPYAAHRQPVLKKH